MLISDGLSDASHRVNLFREEFEMIGISSGKHRQKMGWNCFFSRDTERSLTVINYAHCMKTFAEKATYDKEREKFKAEEAELEDIPVESRLISTDVALKQ